MTAYSALAAVERTFQVMEILVGEVNGVSVTELENRTQLPKSVISRILTTLLEGGYVERDSKTRYYKLSFYFLSMAYRHINALEINDIFYPMLERIAKRTGELVQLAVVKKEGIFFIEKAEGTNPLRVASMLGQKAPYHATAVGKVWLASLTDQEVTSIISQNGLKAYTEHTITDLDTLLKNLAEVRSKGYAIADQEINQDVIAVSVPITLDEQVVAMLVTAAPHFKMTASRIEELVHICREEVDLFDASLLRSFDLGYSPNKSGKITMP
ncbi:MULTISPECIES: IclR family transcriptional regulator [Paenibacillus]|uniref:IclR family transcriptional regulator n=1 Tax=Paenibacillus TaxID=44249 RepID=UPI00088C2FEE|nr:MULTISPECIES: IclR family transcriptional regulator [Paenibacillus]NTZ16840.1 IclR family transcriptional regulator [Paenibacillus sp. JMULE4]GCL70166.1 IclR family transcriptional regulator [Paenibacillus naphthalenovorans]SDH90044.1 DNA-binding transcriptional regulator, IclR family [Paenibacillus naphthalenovorans]